MKKCIVTALILVLALSGCKLPDKLPVKLPALPFKAQAAECAGVTVGLLLADTTANPIAAEQDEGYELAAAAINAGGGISGCPLHLVRAVEAGEEGSLQTREMVRKLVEEESVIAILGATTNTAAMQAVSMLNFFKTPMLVPSVGGDHVLPAENLWGFRLQAGEAVYAQTIFTMVTEQMGEDHTVAILFEDTTEGHDAAAAAVSAAESQGLDVAAYVAIRSTTSSAYEDLAAQIEEIQPEVVYLVFNQPELASDVLLALRTIQPFYTIARAGGPASSVFMSAQPSSSATEAEQQPVMQNLTIAMQWAATAQAVEQEAFFKEYAAARKAGKPETASMHTLAAYKSLRIIASAAARVVSTGKAAPDAPTDFRAALREELRAYQEISPFWGEINFATGGQSPGEVVLVQVIDGRPVIVYPPDRIE